MKKLEFNCEKGIEEVCDFGKDTEIWNEKRTTLTIHDVIDHISRPFDGTIGWIATEEDMKVLREAEYIEDDRSVL